MDTTKWRTLKYCVIDIQYLSVSMLRRRLADVIEKGRTAEVVGEE
jgi:hypothetical protein